MASWLTEDYFTFFGELPGCQKEYNPDYKQDRESKEQKSAKYHPYQYKRKQDYSKQQLGNAPCRLDPENQDLPKDPEHTYSK